MGFFFRRSRAANSEIRVQIGLKFKLNQDFMVVLLTDKNEEDPIKNESARVLTRLYINFLEAQWQLTPQSVVEFRQISLIQALCVDSSKSGYKMDLSVYSNC